MTIVRKIIASTDADQTCAFPQLVDERMSGLASIGACYPAIAGRVFGTTTYSRVDSESRDDAGGQERYALLN